jgi:uncharacterized protein with HEPN domain
MKLHLFLNILKGKQKEDFLSYDLLCHAIVRSLEIIGEASKKVDPDFKTENPALA